MPVIHVNDLAIKTSEPLICLPITLTGNEVLLDKLEETKQATFDLVELRADSLHTSNYLSTILMIKDTLDVPLIFTLRSKQEGGQFQYDALEYYSTLEEVIESGYVDIVDLEYARDFNTLTKLIELCHQNNVKTLLSYHVMDHTPSVKEMKHTLTKMAALSADIVKLATMATTHQDVLNTLQVSNDMKDTLNCPFIIVSMGELGKISRFTGHLFGSCITFAMHHYSNAPGQIDSHQLKELLTTMAHPVD